MSVLQVEVSSPQANDLDRVRQLTLEKQALAQQRVQAERAKQVSRCVASALLLHAARASIHPSIHPSIHCHCGTFGTDATKLLHCSLTEANVCYWHDHACICLATQQLRKLDCLFVVHLQHLQVVTTATCTICAFRWVLEVCCYLARWLRDEENGQVSWRYWDRLLHGKAWRELSCVTSIWASWQRQP